MWRKTAEKQHKLEENQSNSDSEEESVEYLAFIKKIKPRKEPPIELKIKVQGKELSMEVDTGASVSVVGETTWREMWGPTLLPLKPADVRLRTYTGPESQWQLWGRQK